MNAEATAQAAPTAEPMAARAIGAKEQTKPPHKAGGTGRAETFGTGQSVGGGEGRQVSVGSSDARNYAETATETHGRNESAHKRRLYYRG